VTLVPFMLQDLLKLFVPIIKALAGVCVYYCRTYYKAVCRGVFITEVHIKKACTRVFTPCTQTNRLRVYKESEDAREICGALADGRRPAGGPQTETAAACASARGTAPR
jgi:hypothetical protein